MEIVGDKLYEWRSDNSHISGQKAQSRATIAEALGQKSTDQWPTPQMHTVTSWTRGSIAVPLTMASLPDGTSEVTHIVEVTQQEISQCKEKVDTILSWSNYDTLAEPHRLSAIMSAFHTVAPEITQLAWDNDTAWRAIEHAIAENNTGIINLRDLSKKGGNSCASMTALAWAVLALYGYDTSPIAGSMTNEGWHAYLLAKNGPHCFLCDPNNPLNKWTETETPAIQSITASEYDAHTSTKNHTIQVDFGTGESRWFMNYVDVA